MASSEVVTREVGRAGSVELEGADDGGTDGGADRGADGGADGGTDGADGGADLGADGGADRGADGGADDGADGGADVDRGADGGDDGADGGADRGADDGADGGADRGTDIQNVNNVHLWTGRETALFIGECNQPHQNWNGHKPRKKQYIIVSVAPSICRQSHGINMVIIQLISRSNTRLRR